MKQQSLLRAIRNGQRWMEMLIKGEAKNNTDLAAKPGLKPPYVTRVLGLNTPLRTLLKQSLPEQNPMDYPSYNL